jgi:hypothetical protein
MGSFAVVVRLCGRFLPPRWSTVIAMVVWHLSSKGMTAMSTIVGMNVE